MHDFILGDRLYSNPLATATDIASWRSEGEPVVSFPQGCLRLENGVDAEEGQAANYILWCSEVIPADFSARWQFKPLREPGLAMFWCRAHGHDNRDLFDPSLQPRTGQYRQYFDGDINAFHASYFRRKQPDERRFHTCNLRKSHGFHLVAQGPDPLPSVDSVDGWYTIEITACGPWIQFAIDGLIIYRWCDDGHSYGPLNVSDGYIGFRQMAPLIAEYRNLEIFNVSRKTKQEQS